MRLLLAMPGNKDRLDENRAQDYAKIVTATAKPIYGVDHLGVWVDLNTASASKTQTKNMIAMAPHCLRALVSTNP